MSRLRTGIRAGEWRDEGPASVSHAPRNRGTALLYEMVPIVAPYVLTEKQRLGRLKQTETRKAKAAEKKPKGRVYVRRPRCEEYMPLAKATCRRAVGHPEDHRAKEDA